jgi:hypothetical protein
MVAAIALSQPLPTLVRVGQTVTIRGRLTPGMKGVEIALEDRGPNGQQPSSWGRLIEARAAANGAFSLRWRVGQGSSRLVQARVAAIQRRRTIAATAAAQLAIGPAAVPCAAPVPPAVNIPVGDGWIEGGLIIQGGAFPGVYECESQPYTVTATNTATGAVAATMNVAGGHSYTLVVAAGSYTLTTTMGCPGRGTATVSAAMGTTANAFCDVP